MPILMGAVLAGAVVGASVGGTAVGAVVGAAATGAVVGAATGAVVGGAAVGVAAGAQADTTNAINAKQTAIRLNIFSSLEMLGSSNLNGNSAICPPMRPACQTHWLPIVDCSSAVSVSRQSQES